jgi:hypothetical protein
LNGLEIVLGPSLQGAIIERDERRVGSATLHESAASGPGKSWLDESNPVSDVDGPLDGNHVGQPVIPEMSGEPLPESRSSCLGRGTVTVALLVPSNQRLLGPPVFISDQLKGRLSLVM